MDMWKDTSQCHGNIRGTFWRCLTIRIDRCRYQNNTDFSSVFPSLKKYSNKILKSSFSYQARFNFGIAANFIRASPVEKSAGIHAPTTKGLRPVSFHLASAAAATWALYSSWASGQVFSSQLLPNKTTGLWGINSYHFLYKLRNSR